LLLQSRKALALFLGLVKLSAEFPAQSLVGIFLRGALFSERFLEQVQLRLFLLEGLLLSGQSKFFLLESILTLSEGLFVLLVFLGEALALRFDALGEGFLLGGDLLRPLVEVLLLKVEGSLVIVEFAVVLLQVVVLLGEILLLLRDLVTLRLDLGLLLRHRCLLFLDDSLPRLDRLGLFFQKLFVKVELVHVRGEFNRLLLNLSLASVELTGLQLVVALFPLELLLRLSSSFFCSWTEKECNVAAMFDLWVY
jgi:hypothetical protein